MEFLIVYIVFTVLFMLGVQLTTGKRIIPDYEVFFGFVFLPILLGKIIGLIRLKTYHADNLLKEAERESKIKQLTP